MVQNDSGTRLEGCSVEGFMFCEFFSLVAWMCERSWNISAQSCRSRDLVGVGGGSRGRF